MRNRLRQALQERGALRLQKRNPLFPPVNPIKEHWRISIEGSVVYPFPATVLPHLIPRLVLLELEGSRHSGLWLRAGGYRVVVLDGEAL